MSLFFLGCFLGFVGTGVVFGARVFLAVLCLLLCGGSWSLVGLGWWCLWLCGAWLVVGWGGWKLSCG